MVIVFKGEIYNYNEIKEKLINLGHKFKTNTDTEVILHGYEQFGEKILDQLRGMFAFAILVVLIIVISIGISMTKNKS